MIQNQKSNHINSKHKNSKKDFVFKYGSIYNEDFESGSKHLKRQNVEVELVIAEPQLRNSKSSFSKKSNLASAPWVTSAASLLKKGGSFLCICSPEQVDSVLSAAKKARLQYKDILIFENLSPLVDKNVIDKTVNDKKAENRRSSSGRNQKKFFTSSASIILWFIKPGEKVYFNKSGLSYVSPVIKSSYDVDFDKYDERISFFQKPIKLYERLLKLFTKINDTVLYLNANSGSGIIAALILKRNYLAFEKNVKVYENTRGRIEKFKHSNS
ncbi:MAG: site-specific DNA-methyltransferase [Bifidobacteriaceae bacterium]|jgi:DNA modification methylase|nr:site-specific DNA-methyltransferase [Bifidobacteriaceae bacterium]